MPTQPVAHAPAIHLRPASQTLPQLPQFCSVVMSTHVPAQHWSSSLHTVEHAPSCGEPAAEPPVPAVSAPPVPLKPAKVASPPESALLPPLLKLAVPAVLPVNS